MSHFPPRNLSIQPLKPADRADLIALFAAFTSDPGTVAFFHPHPFTAEYAIGLCDYPRRDRYYLARVDGLPVGYSMLRGWDEGYKVPSFGVGVHPGARGWGVGRALTTHAIAESRATGAPSLRLTVFKTNTTARRIYEKHGFRFSDKDADSLLGVLDFSKIADAA